MKESPALDRYLVRSNDSIFNFFNDKLSRQTEAHWSGSGSGRYNSRFFSYDLNGNICKLDPWVAGTPFLETQYNFMNMPEYRRLSSAEEWTVYDANGEKQAVYSYDSSNSTTRKLEYACNLIFYNGSPNWLLTDGGHIELGGDTPVYQWWLTDHLGNVRVVADSLGTISQTNHYDPYGASIEVKPSTITPGNTYYATENLFRFGGKEWNKTFSDYDFSARYFSTDYARFTTQDPLAEKTPNLSPYAYCDGNPMIFVDYDGRKARIYVEKSVPGHAFLTTGELGNTIVYTYGRYGALKPLSGLTSGRFTPMGEGGFGRLSGQAAYDYLYDVLSEDNFDVFELNNFNENKLQMYYDAIFFSSNKKLSNPNNKRFGDPNYRVIDTYYLWSNNCVTTTRRGIEFAGGNILWSNTILPIKFDTDLTIQSFFSDDLTRISEPRYFLEDLLNSFYSQ